MNLRPLVLSAFLIGCAPCAAAGVAAPLAERPAPPLHSFADLYRMTVTPEGASARADAGAASFAQAQEAPQVRFATLQATPAPEAPRFRVTPLAESQRWLLLVAGLATAAWVARRRFAQSY